MSTEISAKDSIFFLNDSESFRIKLIWIRLARKIMALLTGDGTRLATDAER